MEGRRPVQPLAEAVSYEAAQPAQVVYCDHGAVKWPRHSSSQALPFSTRPTTTHVLGVRSEQERSSHRRASDRAREPAVRRPLRPLEKVERGSMGRGCLPSLKRLNRCVTTRHRTAGARRAARVPLAELFPSTTTGARPLSTCCVACATVRRSCRRGVLCCTSTKAYT
eukprot:281132-Chlamydomonas_euryale.AAC.4